MILLHRKSGLSSQEFRERYEKEHRKIGERYLRPYANRYLRRYAHDLDADPAERSETVPDVITEVWFADRQAYDRAMQALAAPEAQEEISADEERLFARERMVRFLVEEYESDLRERL